MKMLIAVTVALAAASATADDYDYCAVLSLIAEKTMEERQNGVPMSRQLDTLSGYGSEVQESIKPIILDAYSVQKFETTDFKRAAITDFGNQTMSSCYKVGITI